jgi:hypothetical protein
MKRCTQCDGPMTADADMWALDKKGQEMWLCGRKKCDKDFSDDVPPKVRKVSK